MQSHKLNGKNSIGDIIMTEGAHIQQRAVAISQDNAAQLVADRSNILEAKVMQQITVMNQKLAGVANVES